jgi:PEGA domain
MAIKRPIKRRSAFVSLYRRVAFFSRVARTTTDAEQWIAGFEQRAAETTKQTEATVAGIAERAAETCTRAEVTVAALTERVAGAATYGEQWATSGEQWFADLQQRAAEATEQAEAAMAGITDRAVATTTRAEETIQGLERRSLDAIARSQESVTNFTDRVAETSKQLEHSVERLKQRAAETTTEADHALAGLAKRAAEAIADLERRVRMLASHQQAIEHTLAQAAQAAHVADDLSAIEERIWVLVGQDKHLKRAEGRIEQLERRAAEVGARLGEVIQAKDKLALELAVLRRQLMPTKPERDDVTPLASPVTRSRTVGERFIPSKWRQAATMRGPVLSGAAIVGVIAVLGLIAMPVMRSLSRRSPGDGGQRATARQAAPSSSARVQPEIPGPSTTIAPAIAARTAAPADSLSPNAPVAAAAALGSGGVPSAALGPSPPAMRITNKDPVGSRLARASSEGPQFAGTLAVQSVPGGAVFVDQRLAGQTPIHLTGVRAGSHVIRIERDGYQRWSAAVTVSDGEETRVAATLQSAAPAGPLSPNPRVAAAAALRPAGVPSAALGTSPPATTITNEDPDGSRLARASAQGLPFAGTLAVQSVPGGVVFVNQRRAGQTPIHLTGVRAGSHVIRIEREGYQRWTAAVMVSDGEETRVAAKLQLDRAH